MLDYIEKEKEKQKKIVNKLPIRKIVRIFIL